jgi:hypothetical protein
MLMLLAILADSSPAAADPRMAEMTALYEQACLKAFPDDKEVEALMTARHARELTPEEVRVTMVDDPARGWELQGNATVWIEFPPYHACSVRWNAPQIGDLQNYRKLVRAYETAAGRFRPIAAYDIDQGDIHIHAVGEQRMLPDKSTESLFIVDQHINDPKRREAGDTGVVIRFVHQFAPPGTGG